LELGLRLTRGFQWTIWIADAHRGGKRFVVHTDEKLAAFLEPEAVTKVALRTAESIHERSFELR